MNGTKGAEYSRITNNNCYDPAGRAILQGAQKRTRPNHAKHNDNLIQGRGCIVVYGIQSTQHVFGITGI